MYDWQTSTDIIRLIHNVGKRFDISFMDVGYVPTQKIFHVEALDEANGYKFHGLLKAALPTHVMNGVVGPYDLTKPEIVTIPDHDDMLGVLIHLENGFKPFLSGAGSHNLLNDISATLAVIMESYDIHANLVQRTLGKDAHNHDIKEYANPSFQRMPARTPHPGMQPWAGDITGIIASDFPENNEATSYGIAEIAKLLKNQGLLVEHRDFILNLDTRIMDLPDIKARMDLALAERTQTVLSGPSPTLSSTATLQAGTPPARSQKQTT